MNEEAAMRGLEMVFSSWYHHTSTQKGGNTTDANIEVRKAVSRALGVLTHIRPVDRKAANYVGDYFKSKQYANTSYQLRLGSLYFPLQPINTRFGGANGSLYESYHHTQRGFGKIKTASAPTGVSPISYVIQDYGFPESDTYEVKATSFNVSHASLLPTLTAAQILDLKKDHFILLADGTMLEITDVPTTGPTSNIFTVRATNTPLVAAGNTGAWSIVKFADEVPEHFSFDRGMACFYTDLERSSTQRLTGVPVNNSRVAEVQIKDNYAVGTNEPWTGYLTEIWLHYVRLARVFLQNVEIEE
jgi:hypothetical protein